MSNRGAVTDRYLRHLLILTLMTSYCLPFQVAAAEEQTDAADTEVRQALNETELQSLQSILAELRSLAPKLRVLLRTLRQQVGFDPREVHSIERGLSQSQKDVERLIAMHKRRAFNRMRAHFMADDLRRKSEGLKASLGYIMRRIRELDEASGDRQANAELKKNDEALVEQLRLYSNLVSDGVDMLREKVNLFRTGM
ncbi:MAG: hypothetical protein P8166_11350 [Candidatus Thiodiazotropha sp.]|jgi:hypothetical protein